MPRPAISRLAAVALLMAAPTAAEPADAKPTDATLEAEMRFMGMSVGTVELEIASEGERQAQRLAMATTGLVERLTGFRGELKSESRNGGDRPAPLAFDSFTRTDRATRQVEIRYDDDGRVVDLATFKRDKRQDSEVPEALRHDTVDPLTALSVVRGWLHGVRDDVPASTVVPVFDGRRRYDLVVDYVDRRVATFASGPTPVLEARLETRAIAGFDEEADGQRAITILLSDDEVLAPLVMRTDVMGDLSAALYTRRVCTPAGGEGGDCRTYRY